VGAYSQFRESMIAGLSTADRPALQGLGTRADDDFTIALLDAWAVAADVVTFYQERIANESYVPTATERFSLRELSRLIGYRLRPGVAASAWIAFTLESAPGAPASITIDSGVKIQSVPGPGESPQTFETVEAIQARPAWNAMRALQARPQILDRRTRSLWLQGVATQLKPGDAILIVGNERIDDYTSDRWDFRILTDVQPDPDRDRTRIAWRDPLGQFPPRPSLPSGDSPRLFALRQRAALFGHNAPDPSLLNPNVVAGTEWDDFDFNPDLVDLDAVYPGIVVGSWLAFVAPDYSELSRADEVTSLSRSDFAISAKVTRVTPDGFENKSKFTKWRRETAVFAQSEELDIIDAPIRAPVVGLVLELGHLEPELAPGQPIAASGPRQHLRVTPTGNGRLITGSDGTTTPAVPGMILSVSKPPVWNTGGAPLDVDEIEQALVGRTDRQVAWKVRTEAGFEGALVTSGAQVALVQPPKDAAIVRERLTIDTAADAVLAADGRTVIQLTKPLRYCYDREAVRFNANVAHATHGEHASEILGQGDASRSFQRFPLKQPPLTYVGADNPEGFTSTLEVRVNDLLWTEVPSFFDRTPRDRVYVTAQSDDGITTVLFGDARTGARLPTGVDNVRASYRKGIGLAGLLDAGQLNQLMTRPLGVSGAINPEATAGAAGAEMLPEARTKAPLSVRTLGRAVSLQDYEDFARAFIGIGKARATWVWDGRIRRVLITIAGLDGDVPETGDDLPTRLVSAMTSAGDPFVPFIVVPYRKVTFAVEAGIEVDTPTYQTALVLRAVEDTLAARCSFAARDLGAPIALSQLYAIIQAVPGVLGVAIEKLYRLQPGGCQPDGPLGKRPPVVLPADSARIDPSGALVGSELLAIDLACSQLRMMA
jgi:hypothetical protein